MSFLPNTGKWVGGGVRAVGAGEESFKALTKKNRVGSSGRCSIAADYLIMNVTD